MSGKEEAVCGGNRLISAGVRASAQRAALDLAEAAVDDEEDVDRLAAAVGKLEKSLDTLWKKLEGMGTGAWVRDE